MPVSSCANGAASAVLVCVGPFACMHIPIWKLLSFLPGREPGNVGNLYCRTVVSMLFFPIPAEVKSYPFSCCISCHCCVCILAQHNPIGLYPSFPPNQRSSFFPFPSLYTAADFIFPNLFQPGMPITGTSMCRSSHKPPKPALSCRLWSMPRAFCPSLSVAQYFFVGVFFLMTALQSHWASL